MMFFSPSQLSLRNNAKEKALPPKSKFRQKLEKSLERLGNPGKAWEILGNPGKFREMLENHVQELLV